MLHIGAHSYEVKMFSKLDAIRGGLGVTEYVDDDIYGKPLYCD